MKNMKNLQRLLICGLTAVLVMVMVWGASGVLTRNDSFDRFSEFYSCIEDYDVLFLGSSHVQNAVIPMVLWEQNGITSYNLSSADCRTGLAYWLLQNALYHGARPRTVVLDCAYLYDAKVSAVSGYNHMALDSVPVSKLKFQAVFDLFDTMQERLSYLFPFSLYHSRWEELTTADFDQKIEAGKMGFVAQNELVTARLPKQMVQQPMPVDNVSSAYLRRIITECQENGIDVLLTFLPFRMNEASQNDAAWIAELAGEYGVNYLDPNQILHFIDFRTHFYNNADNNSHLNTAGAHVYSHFMGNYLAEHYGLADHRSDPAYAHWNDLYRQYGEFKQANLQAQISLLTYLVALSDRSYQVIADVQDPVIWQNDSVRRLLEKMGVEPEQMTDSTRALIIDQAIRTAESFESFWDDGAVHDTLLGQFSIQYDEADTRIMCLDGQPLLTLIPYERRDVGIRLTVLDRSTGEMIDSAAFSTAVEGERMVFVF